MIPTFLFPGCRCCPPPRDCDSPWGCAGTDTSLLLESWSDHATTELVDNPAYDCWNVCTHADSSADVDFRIAAGGGRVELTNPGAPGPPSSGGLWHDFDDSSVGGFALHFTVQGGDSTAAIGAFIHDGTRGYRWGVDFGESGDGKEFFQACDACGAGSGAKTLTERENCAGTWNARNQPINLVLSLSIDRTNGGRAWSLFSFGAWTLGDTGLDLDFSQTVRLGYFVERGGTLFPIAVACGSGGTVPCSRFRPVAQRMTLDVPAFDGGYDSMSLPSPTSRFFGTQCCPDYAGTFTLQALPTTVISPQWVDQFPAYCSQAGVGLCAASTSTGNACGGPEYPSLHRWLLTPLPIYSRTGANNSNVLVGNFMAVVGFGMALQWSSPPCAIHPGAPGPTAFVMDRMVWILSVSLFDCSPAAANVFTRLDLVSPLFDVRPGTAIMTNPCLFRDADVQANPYAVLPIALPSTVTVTA